MKALRAAVSGSRVRYMKDGYDMDLTYITPRLMAMGYPASGVEKTYRNDISEVAAFLNSHHPDAYRIFNLSERRYDYSKFEGRVAEWGFPDHHPPPLQVLLDMMNEMIEWTAKGSKHVIVVHCLAGKGRTGVVCSCYLLLTGYYGNIFRLRKERELRELANASIRDFWNARGQGVRYPSQALYIYYFIKVVRRLGRTPTQIPPLLPAKKMLLRRVVLHGIPDYEATARGGCTPFLQVLPAPWQNYKPDLLYNSAWQRPKFETYMPDANGTIVFEINCVIQGDTLIRCFHANTANILGKHLVQMFHFTFNTDFFHKNSDLYRLPKEEVDEATRSRRYPPSFHVDCHVQVLTGGRNDLPDDSGFVTERDRLYPSGEHLHPDFPASMHQTSQPTIEAAQVPAPQHHGALTSSFHQQQQQQAVAIVADEETPTMMGWLYKMGGFVKNWKRRWFVAREGTLTYFHKASDPTPLGSVDLHSVTVDVCEPSEINARNQCLHYFRVVPPRAGMRTWYFGAESEADLVAWIRVLGAQSCYGVALDRERHSNQMRGMSSRQPLVRSLTFTSGDHGRTPSDHGSEFFNSGGAPPPPPSQLLQQQHASYHSTRERSSLPTKPVRAFGSASHHAGAPIGATDEEFDDERYLSSINQPAYEPSVPVDMSSALSEDQQASLLQEVEACQAQGAYIYSADELEDAAKLQQHLRITPLAPGAAVAGPVHGPETLESTLRRLVASRQLAEAEQLLTEVVLTRFPRLVDAMDYDPLAFTQLVAGGDISAIGGRFGNGGGDELKAPSVASRGVYF